MLAVTQVKWHVIGYAQELCLELTLDARCEGLHEVYGLASLRFGLLIVFLYHDPLVLLGLWLACRAQIDHLTLVCVKLEPCRYDRHLYWLRACHCIIAPFQRE